MTKGPLDNVVPPLRAASAGLAKLCLRLGLITEKDIAVMLSGSAGAKLLHGAARRGLINENEALDAVAAELKIERVALKGKALNIAAGQDDLLKLFERRFMLERRFVPLARGNESVQVALADPLDLETIGEIEFAVQSRVRVALASEPEIVDAISRFLPEGLESLGDLDEVKALAAGSHEVEISASDSPEEGAADAGIDSAPIVQLVNKMLEDAAAANASDVHLEPSAKNLDIRFRIDGILSPYIAVAKKLQPYITTRVKLLAGMDIAERRRPQDGRFRIKITARASLDIRASCVPTPFGEKLVLRLLRADFEGVDFGSLGMLKDFQKRYEQVLGMKDKMVIVSGPTGSGKTTTLYAGINRLKQSTNNIVTVEDPIEFRIEGATQIQVDAKVGITFASGLRSILRQDPDVILVGEIRDLETAQIAFQAAQTGHLVLSTLHTNSAESAIIRLRDLGLESYLIASSLGAVIAQRLVRRLCERCAEPVEAAEGKRLAKRHKINAGALRRSVGCPDCEGSGYRGRLAVYSLLLINSEIEEAIRNGAGEAEIRELGARNGLVPLPRAALSLVEQGLTTIAEVERVVGPADLETKRAVSGKTNKPVESPKPSPTPTSPSPVKLSVAELAKEASTSAAPRPKILLVDDDDGVRAVMLRALKSADFQVMEASDGLDALKKMQVFLPDLIVSDLIMPRLDGREFVLKLREIGLTRRIPVLMLTGSDNEEIEIALIEAGAQDFVSKTSSPAVVVARVKRLLAAHGKLAC